MIMSRYNQTRGSDAFSRMFSCASNGCVSDACGRGRAGWRWLTRRGGGMRRSVMAADVGVVERCVQR